jgi:hypothetical protein
MLRMQNQFFIVVRLGRNTSVRRQTFEYTPSGTKHFSVTAVGMQHVHGLAEFTTIEGWPWKLKVLWNQLMVNEVGQQIPSVQDFVVVENINNRQPVLMYGATL